MFVLGIHQNKHREIHWQTDALLQASLMGFSVTLNA